MSVVHVFPGAGASRSRPKLTDATPSAHAGTGRGYDERCAADLAAVAEGRELSREETGWLARVVCGAVRPNRDRPLWDLAHLVRALTGATGARDGRALLDLVLDPRLARAAALARRMDGAPSTDPGGFVLEDQRPWRTSWSGAARLLGLMEFILTADDLAHFGEVRGWLDELAADPGAESVTLLVSRLSRLLAQYRNAHMPLAPHEKRFRAILDRLGGRTAFDDDDILGLWRDELGEGTRANFETVAGHFVTFEAVVQALGGLSGLTAAASLDGLPGAAERLHESLAEVAGAEPADGPIVLLAAMPDTVKVLTGAERDDVAALLRLDPFHRSRPLTVLRAASFGQVQSGLSNRLRRGGGGASIAERTTCAEAQTYDVLTERTGALIAHLRRMMAIAAALRIAPEHRSPAARDALALADADLKRLRRAGFDADRTTLAVAFAGADAALVGLAEELAALQRGLAALADRASLSALFETDRATFAAALARAYCEDAP